MNCNSSVAMVHLLNAVFGHKNNQIRNEGHRNCASASSCRMQHRNATNTEPICALRQTQANELRITSVYRLPGSRLPGVPLPERGHDQPMRRSALGARPAPAHGHWRGDRERWREAADQPPLHPSVAQGAPGSRLRHSVLGGAPLLPEPWSCRQGPHRFRASSSCRKDGIRADVQQPLYGAGPACSL